MHVDHDRPIGVAVIGAGYWGPNIIRNLSVDEGCVLHWVCDASAERAARAVGRFSTIGVTDCLDRVLDDEAVEAVVVATPPSTHAELTHRCLGAGRHVLVEKPLARSIAEGEGLVAEAKQRDLVLMLDHTYCYTPAVQKLRELVDTGALGEIQYIDSVRINLGIVQRDVDVLWDLAPHDLSILDVVLPGECVPTAVAAHGADPLDVGHPCVGYLTLPLSNGGIVHIHVNWLSPMKIRTTVIGGSRRTVVWDDVNPTQRLSIYDRGVDVGIDGDGNGPRSEATRTALLVSYRVGDMVAPALPETEALRNVVSEFVGAIRGRRTPLTDGAAGLRVLRVLEAASLSLRNGGALVPLLEYR